MKKKVCPKTLYIDLIKKCLTRTLFNDPVFVPIMPNPKTPGGFFKSSIQKLFQLKGLEIVFSQPIDYELRSEGKDWPKYGETMTGLKRLNNLEDCVRDIIEKNVPGDLIETGVWKGGSVIFMRAILKAFGDTNRRVWVADSFEGLPKPDEKNYPQDKGDTHHMYKDVLGVSMEDVQNNFKQYGLLDDQVKFLKGWFKDTLPTAPIKNLSILRLDGDMYESTMDALTHLYPKLSVGGYIIVDDYGTVEGCKSAIEDFRDSNRIDEPIQKIDHSGVFWQKTI